MARRLSLPPAAIGLVLANVLSILAVIGSCLTATHAAEARDRARAALAETRGGLPAEAAIRASTPKLRTKRLDRLLLMGTLGVLGSAFCTWHLLKRASARDRSLVSSASPAGRRR